MERSLLRLSTSLGAQQRQPEPVWARPLVGGTNPSPPKFPLRS